MFQLSTPARNGLLDAIETAAGASAILKIRTGAPPANCAAADTGSVVATVNLPADWMAAASGGVKAKSGTWDDNSADGPGTSGHFRAYASDGTTCHLQGTCGAQVQIPTTASTAANGNALTFSATTGIAVGMNVTGTGIPALATVVAVTGTTVTLSATSTAGVANGASVTFSPDMIVDNAVFATGQAFSITAFSLTAPNA